jgi:Bacterial Ig-like domain (group 2)
LFRIAIFTLIALFAFDVVFTSLAFLRLKKMLPSNHTMHQILNELRAINHREVENGRLLRKLLRALNLLVEPVSMTAKLQQDGQETDMPLSVPVGATGVVLAVVEKDANGNIVSSAAPLTYASDNTAVATVDSNGNVTPLSAGTANISSTDPGVTPPLTASDSLTVTGAGAGAPVSMTATLQQNASGNQPAANASHLNIKKV